MLLYVKIRTALGFVTVFPVRKKNLGKIRRDVILRPTIEQGKKREQAEVRTAVIYTKEKVTPAVVKNVPVTCFSDFSR